MKILCKILCKDCKSLFAKNEPNIHHLFYAGTCECCWHFADVTNVDFFLRLVENDSFNHRSQYESASSRH